MKKLIVLGSCLLAWTGVAQSVVPIASLRETVDPISFLPGDTDTLFSVEGVVTTHVNLTSSSHALFYIQDDSAGIPVFWRNGGGENTPSAGDRVRVTAPLSHFRGLLQLAANAENPETSVTVLSTGGDLVEPQAFSFALANDPASVEQIEGSLVVVEGVTIQTEETSFDGGSNYTIEDDLGNSFTLRIDSRTPFEGQEISDAPVDIVGVVGQFTSDEPAVGGYQILPTRLSDLSWFAEAAGVSSISEVRATVDESTFLPSDTETIFTVEGIVTTHVSLTSSSHSLFYLQDSSAGIAVFWRDGGVDNTPAAGDRVRVSAPLSEFRGLLQLAPNAGNAETSVEVISSGNAMPDAVALDFGAADAALEVLEGSLVVARGVTLTTDDSVFSGGANYTLTDGAGTEFTLRIDSRVPLEGVAIPDGGFDVLGVLGQFTSNEPALGGYQILPSRVEDLMAAAEPVATVSIAAVRQTVDTSTYLPSDTESLFTVEGVVTTHVSLTSDSHSLFYMQDETAGIPVFWRDGGVANTPAAGDLVRVTAPVSNFRGLLQLAPNASNAETSVDVLSRGNPLPEAVSLGFEMPDVDLEALEGSLVVARGVSISSDDTVFSGGSNLTLTDAAGAEFTLRIDSRTSFDGEMVPEGSLDVVGVLGQFTSNEPALGGYQVLPSRVEDLIASGSIDPGPSLEGTPATIAELRDLVDPENLTPLDMETIFAVEGVVTTSINLTTDSNVLFYMQEGDAGIAVFYRDLSGDNVPQLGDRVRVVGPLAHFNGLLELVPNAGDPTTGMTVLAQGQTLPEAVELDLELLNDPVAMDRLEASLVKITDATIDRTEGDTFPDPSGNLAILGPNGDEFTLRVDSRTDIGGQSIPEGLVTITGVVGQFDSSDPRSSGYQILPDVFSRLETPFKAPTIEYSITILNGRRPVSASMHQYREFALHPGETAVIDVSVSDSTGRVVDLSALDNLPEGASWAIPQTSGEMLTARLELTATASLEGQLIQPTLSASNDAAAADSSWSIYVPTAVEQQVFIGEFMADPTADPESPKYNPLVRHEEDILEDAYNPRSHDEFVEIVNLSGEDVELAGWTFSDAASLRHQFFTSFVIQPGGAGIIYGGPANGLVPELDIPVTPASQNDFLGLNNGGGDELILRNADGNVIDRFRYEEEQLSELGSVTLFPDAFGVLVGQDSVSEEAATPGFSWDGVNAWGDASSANNSVFARLEPGDAGYNLVWPTQPGRTYSVWSADSVTSEFTIWMVVGPITDAGESSVALDVSGEQQFFFISEH